nr:hypothetical protein BaRGS_034539 [Batillaria attramentaria]
MKVGNAIRAKSYYVVHPEWNSETVADPKPTPLNRPPWSWEQPRYRVNVQVPITYESPVKMVPSDLQPPPVAPYDFSREPPPLSCQLTQVYRSTHPEYVMRY